MTSLEPGRLRPQAPKLVEARALERRLEPPVENTLGLGRLERPRSAAQPGVADGVSSNPARCSPFRDRRTAAFRPAPTATARPIAN